MILFLITIPYRHTLLEKEKKEIQGDLCSSRILLSQQKENFEKEKNSLEKDLNDNTLKINGFKKRYNLSLREIEVLEGILKGNGNKDIGENLYITPETVKYHCSKLYLKTNIKNRSQLTALFNTRTVAQKQL